MAEYIKKFGVLFILLVLLPVLGSCDGLQENAEMEYNYLNISADNQYGIEEMEPDPGRYPYDEVAVVEIDFAESEGYEFLGWQGEDGGEVVKDNGNYKIKVDEDKDIKAALELKDFKPLEIDFSGIEPIDYGDAETVTGVPHNLEDVEISFNNELYDDDDLEVRIEDPNSDSDGEDESTIELENVEVDENSVMISLTDWRDSFYTDEEESSLEFGEEYQLIVETPYDVDNREFEEDELVVNFKVEEPYPEVPGNVRFDEDKTELSWRRSKANAKIELAEDELDGDKYVGEYIVYKFVGESDFKEEDADEEIVLENVDPDKKVVRYEGEINETENIYYRVKAVNTEYDNKSDFSEVVEVD